VPDDCVGRELADAELTNLLALALNFRIALEKCPMCQTIAIGCSRCSRCPATRFAHCFAVRPLRQVGADGRLLRWPGQPVLAHAAPGRAHPRQLRPSEYPELPNYGLELTTGAQREHRHDVLLAQAQDKGVDPGPISYYLDFFRYGAPPHGGYGFGLTRLLMQLLGQDNVREVTFLYRGPHRLMP
jgi:hypothetical protein